MPRGGESAAAVADFGEKLCGSDLSGSGQAGEDVRIGVRGELVGDLFGEGLDLFDEGAQGSDQCVGDVGVGGAVFAGDTAGRGGQPGVQDGGTLAAGVADLGQPGAETFGGQPVGAVLAVEPGQECQADRRIEFGEHTHGTGEGAVEVFAQLVGHADAVSDELFAGSAARPQRHGGRAIGDQRSQPDAVGAQRVGQHVGVEPVVFVAGRAVAATQVLQLVGADHHHGDPRVQQHVHDRAVGAFDGHFLDPGTGQDAHQCLQPHRAVVDGAAQDFLTSRVDHRDRVIITGPIDSAGQSIGGFRRQDGSGILHHSLLAARPSGEAPKLRCRGVTAGSLTVRRSVALSPVDGRHTPGDRRVSRNSSWTSMRQALVAMTRRHLGCIGNPSKITDTRMVHQC